MVTTTDLISHYEFEETSGTAADAHGSNDSTAETGFTYSATGKINNCFSYDGSADYVTLPSNASLEPSTDTFSITAWINSDTNNAYRNVIAKDKDGNYSYAIRMDNTGKMQFYIGTSGGTTGITGSTTLSTNTWYHVAAVYDGTDIRLYINGSSDATPVSKTGNITYGTTKVLLIGAFNQSGSVIQEWDGEIDELNIWDRALSSSDVSDLYNGGDGVEYPFTSNITINPSAFALSTSEESPSYFLNINEDTLTLTSNIETPTLTVPKTILPSALSLNMEFLDPLLSTAKINTGTVEVGTGTIGTKFIRTDYPVIEGLEAGTTKLKQNPNLIP